jgi:hypothetical protein
MTQRVGDRLVKGSVPDPKIILVDPGRRSVILNYESGTGITIKYGSSSGSVSFVTIEFFFNLDKIVRIRIFHLDQDPRICNSEFWIQSGSRSKRTIYFGSSG